MADCVDDRHVTCDEYLDPRCEPCFDSKKRNILVLCYCHECHQFMCSDCHVYHGKFSLAKNHFIVRGSKMPKSMADKPPKYERCDNHPSQWKDRFCCDHKELVCSTCSDTHHKTCLIKSVDDVCKTIPTSENDALCDAVKNLNDIAKSVKDAIETNLEDLAEQRNHLMQETKILHENAISKVNELFQNSQSEIAAEYKSLNEQFDENKEKIADINTRIDGEVDKTKKLKGKPFDAKLFLKAREHVQVINQIMDDFRALNQSRRLVSMSFDHSHLSKEILSASATLGSVKKEESKPDANELSDITFPQSIPTNTQPTQITTRPMGNQQSPTLPILLPAPGISGQISTKRQITPSSRPVVSLQDQIDSLDLSHHRVYNLPAKFQQPKGDMARSRSVLASVPLTQIKATKQTGYNIQAKDDNKRFLIAGMAITKNNRMLLVDRNNVKVKLFSPDMKHLFSVSVTDTPWGIAVVNDDTAVVTTEKQTLVLLNVSKTWIFWEKLSISRTVKLDYTVRGISNCKDKLAVTSPFTAPPSVKLIDQTGRVYWSVSQDQQGWRLFLQPLYVCCHDNDGTSTVVVTDCSKKTLTLLKAETGEVVTTRQLEGNKRPSGVTTDTAGNVYVCCRGTGEVSVLTGDLSEERILLTGQDGLSEGPHAIVYNQARQQLIVSSASFFENTRGIDCFQLS